MVHLKPNKNGAADISEFSGFISTKPEQHYQYNKTGSCYICNTGSIDGSFEIN